MKSGTLLFAAAAAAAVAGCNQGSETNTAKVSANNAAAAPKHPTYCFFTDTDTKGWSASRDATGNVSVKGKAHLEDNRYAAELGQPEISGTSASLWLTMGPNTGAYGAPENWWDVKTSIPNSSAVDTVTIICGTKTVAQLKVPAAKAIG
jgi:hypothetical protein